MLRSQDTDERPGCRFGDRFHLKPENPLAYIVNSRGRLHLNTITVSIVYCKQQYVVAAALHCSVSCAPASAKQPPMP